MSPHIFLVAGEESGDRLGAALIAAIKRRTKGQVHFSCVGGAHMAAEGVPSSVSTRRSCDYRFRGNSGELAKDLATHSRSGRCRFIRTA